MDTKGKIKILDFFANNPVFSLDEAATKLDSPRGRIGAVERLKYYLKTDRLKLVTRGIYAVVPPGGVFSNFQPDQFLVAQTVRKDAIFSYHSALELLGTAHSTWNQCMLYTTQRRSQLVLKNSSIHFLRDPDSFSKTELRNLGTRKVEQRGRLLTVTGPERTLVDGFRRPRLCGGVEELIQSASGFPVLDLDMLNKILECYDIANLWAATGWFLERYQDNFHVSEPMLKEIKKHCPQSPQYLERDRRGGILIPRWNLILPESIAKRNSTDEP
jgi:predicted transcriptional regulator of viral defense system